MIASVSGRGARLEWYGNICELLINAFKPERAKDTDRP